MLRRLFISMLLAMAGSIFAQGSAGHDYPLYLLSFPSVQKELKISKAAIGKMEKIRKESQAKYMAMIAPDPKNPNSIRQADRTAIAKERARSDAAMLVLLSSAQKQRLEQIGYQYDGAFALARPNVIKKLGITGDQSKKLEDSATAALIQYRKTTAPIVKPGSIAGPDRPNFATTAKKLAMAKVALMKAASAGAMKILTPKQRAKWNEMQGKPFDVSPLYAPVPHK